MGENEWGYKIDRMLASMARNAVLEWRDQDRSPEHLKNTLDIQSIRAQLLQALK